MDVTPLLPKGRQIIHAYGDHGFRINDIRYEGAVVILPDETRAWGITHPDEISLETLPIAAMTGVEILLIGSGLRGVLLPPALRKAYREAGVAIEVMDTGAACRTFNVLLVEERRVAAALLPV